MSQTEPAPATPSPAATPESNPLWPQVLIGAVVGAAVLGLGAFIISRGAGGSDDPARPIEVSMEGRAAAPDPFVNPLAGWETPTAAVVLTGEVHGYLEPCGCSEKQNGGVARRSALFKELREGKGWEVVAADAGGTVRRNRLQTELKFAAMRRALDQMGYGLLNLGPEELRLGMEYLVQHVYDPPPMLGANVVLFGDVTGDDGERYRHRPHARFGGGRRARSASPGSSARTLADELAALDRNSQIGVAPAAELLPAALTELADCDVRVLLSQAEPDETTRFLKEFPGFHVAVTAGRAGGSRSPKPEVVATPAGDALLLRVGHKGKHVGVLGVYPPPEAGPTVRRCGYGRSSRSPRIATATTGRWTPVMAQYQQSIADNLEEVFADLPPSAPPRPGGYVGAAKCGECHTKAYAKWKESPHAKALVSLTEGRAEFEGDWADRRLDPECLSCHVTGWNAQELLPVRGRLSCPNASPPAPRRAVRTATQGLAGLDRFHKLQGQQCENCHGPGSGHTALFDPLESGPVLRQRRPSSARRTRRCTSTSPPPRESTCVKCHDGDNSPDFDFAEYWPKIVHPWRD